MPCSRVYDWSVCKLIKSCLVTRAKGSCIFHTSFIICQIGPSVILNLDFVMLLDLAEGLHREKDNCSFQKQHRWQFSKLIYAVFTLTAQTFCIRLTDHTKSSWMLLPQEGRNWEWSKLKRMVNLGSFLAISELSFSKTTGNRAALKNSLMKHISELFTIQVQADFDREILGNLIPTNMELPKGKRKQKWKGGCSSRALNLISGHVCHSQVLCSSSQNSSKDKRFESNFYEMPNR